MKSQDTDTPQNSKPTSASQWLNKHITEAKGAYISATALTIVSAGCFIIFCWYLSNFVAIWLNSGQILPIQLIYSIIFLTGRYLFAYLASRLNYKAGNIIIKKIKEKLYPTLLSDSQIDSVSSTLLITRVSDDLKPYFAFFIPYAIASIFVSALLLGVSFYVEMWVGVILLASLLVIPMHMIVIGVGAEELHKKHINLFMRYSAIFYNRLQTVAEIVNLDNTTAQTQFLSTKSDELNKATTNVMRVAILSSAILELIVTIAIAAIAIYLGMSLLGIMMGPNYGQGYNFQTALFLLSLAPYFFFYLRKFVSAYHDRNRALASAKLLMPLLDKTPDEVNVDTEEPLFSLEIDKMSYSYPNSPIKVLHNIDLHLPLKGLILIKGISGSGKSTLLKLLAGSLSAKNGTLSVNKKDNAWSSLWLKENTCYMNQFPFIFDETLFYNVFLEEGKEIPDHYPIFLDKIVDKKEDRWQTKLSHNGKQLSGGEKQLITLARMLLHKKPIAILDEPTANLDTDTVAIILPEIIRFAQSQLVIVASHESMFETLADFTLSLNWGEQME